MSTATEPRLARLRTRWSAVGAAVAITLGGGGFGLAQAAVSSGDKPITVTVDAERVLDTRVNLGLAGGFASATPRDLKITGSVDVARPNNATEKKTVVPAGATAVLVNVTIVTPTAPGFLTLRAKGALGAPTTSTVNFTTGSIEPNAATVDLSSDGQIQVWVKMASPAGTADVLVDIVGYTFDHNHDDRYYTEGEVDGAVAAAVAPKANTADIYTKTQVDAAVAPKANSADVYTKTQVDAAVDAKVDQSEYDFGIATVEQKITDSNGVASAFQPGFPDLDIGVETTVASLAIDVAQPGKLIINTNAQIVRTDSGASITCRIKVDNVNQSSSSSQLIGVAFSAVSLSDTTAVDVSAGVHDVAFTCTASGANTDAGGPTLTVVYSANEV